MSAISPVDCNPLIQATAVPEVDRRRVTRVEKVRDGFQLVLDDGETARAARGIVAAQKA